MDHLQQFSPRTTLSLPHVEDRGWRLKRYAILADGRVFDDTVASAASAAAISRLPAPGDLSDGAGNHGLGFQIIHFAQVAVVSPVFYWQWGSVLARGDQMRANWNKPTQFETGPAAIIGCVWEMDIVAFEVDAWRATLLTGKQSVTERCATYLQKQRS